MVFKSFLIREIDVLMVTKISSTGKMITESSGQDKESDYKMVLT